MSDFQVTVQSDDPAHLEPAIQLCLAHRVFSHKEATHYNVDQKGITLYWIDPGKGMALPYPMGIGELPGFLKGWLTRQPRSIWGDEPDTDGDTARGYRITTTGSFEAILTLSPAWIVYDKLGPVHTKAKEAARHRDTG